MEIKVIENQPKLQVTLSFEEAGKLRDILSNSVLAWDYLKLDKEEVPSDSIGKFSVKTLEKFSTELHSELYDFCDENGA